MKSENKSKPEKPKTIKEKAREIIHSNPMFIQDEPATMGSPENLLEEDKKDESEDE